MTETLHGLNIIHALANWLRLWFITFLLLIVSFFRDFVLCFVLGAMLEAKLNALWDATESGILNLLYSCVYLALWLCKADLVERYNPMTRPQSRLETGPDEKNRETRKVALHLAKPDSKPSMCLYLWEMGFHSNHLQTYIIAFLVGPVLPILNRNVVGTCEIKVRFNPPHSAKNFFPLPEGNWST